MTVVAALYRDARSAERHDVALDGTLRDPAWRPFDVVVDELSTTGFRVPATTRLDAGDAISLGLPGVGMCPARVVRRMGRQYGCVFDAPLSDDQLDAALRATASRPVVLGALTRKPLTGPDVGGPADQRLSGPVRVSAIAGIAAAAWAGIIAAFDLLAG